jgi:hypothetical protein
MAQHTQIKFQSWEKDSTNGHYNVSFKDRPGDYYLATSAKIYGIPGVNEHPIFCNGDDRCLGRSEMKTFYIEVRDAKTHKRVRELEREILRLVWLDAIV